MALQTDEDQVFLSAVTGAEAARSVVQPRIRLRLTGADRECRFRTCSFVVARMAEPKQRWIPSRALLSRVAVIPGPNRPEKLMNKPEVLSILLLLGFL